MATTAPPANTSTVRPASQPLRVPPDDTTWKKYSAHNEAPLSFVCSAALHVIVLGLLIFYVFVLLHLFRSQPQPLPIETIRMPGGGGGNPKGSGTGSGVGNPMEDVANSGNDPAASEAPLVQRPQLTIEEQSAVKVEFNNDPVAQRFVEDGNENMKMLSRLDKEVRDKLRAGVNPPPGKGQGGVGKDGGKGNGEGPGNGSGKGDGRILNEREKRMLRWSMSFDTRSGQDYLNQLTGLGATIAVPVGDGKDYKICDLSKRPFQLVDEDLSKVKKIYWMDDKPGSVRMLMAALGVGGNPSHFVAFMPLELEEKLADMEKKYNGLSDDQIYETKFKCVRSGAKYDVVVTGQTRK